MPLTIKINPNLYDRQPTKSEALRIIAQIDLLKGYIRSLVQLQLHDIERCQCAYHHIHTAFRGTDFHVHIHS